MTARNRVFFAPTSVGYADQGMLTPAAVEHYGRRAQGGVGAVMTEHFAVSEAGWQHPRQPGAWSDRHTPGLARLAAEIRRHGALAIAQLSHAGRYAGPWDDYHRRRRLAPSAIPFQLPTAEVCPAEMTAAEIASTVREFAAAAHRVIEAGFDGVEIHGGSGFLIAGFLSPRTNLRQDRYGVSHRSRFALEVLAACRATIGPEGILGYHLMTDELMPGGLSLASALAMLPALEYVGVDMIRPGTGTFESLREPHNAGHSARPAFQHDDTVAVAGATSIPVLAGGGIVDPAVVERIIGSGEAAAVALARPLLADPDWVATARAGGRPVGCACSPSLCLSTQLRGAICSSWPETARRAGFFGYKSTQSQEEQ